MMVHLDDAAPGQFCWVDLAASDAGAAKAFYGELFGWTRASRPPMRQLHAAAPIRSGRWFGLSAQRAAPREMACPRTGRRMCASMTSTLRCAAPRARGEVIVRPFVADGTARIALILDASARKSACGADRLEQE